MRFSVAPASIYLEEICLVNLKPCKAKTITWDFKLFL
jgi:hypothetical protein